ncbi:hypothetical protein D1872_222400 [compost metagenome]
MVLSHIPQGAGMIVVTSAFLHPYRFTKRNLHIGNMLIIPQWFKEGIRKANHLNILYHFLAKIVINPINFFFGKYFSYFNVQFLCRFEVITEWLLNY